MVKIKRLKSVWDWLLGISKSVGVPLVIVLSVDGLKGDINFIEATNKKYKLDDYVEAHDDSEPEELVSDKLTCSDSVTKIRGHQYIR